MKLSAKIIMIILLINGFLANAKPQSATAAPQQGAPDSPFELPAPGMPGPPPHQGTPAHPGGAAPTGQGPRAINIGDVSFSMSRCPLERQGSMQEAWDSTFNILSQIESQDEQCQLMVNSARRLEQAMMNLQQDMNLNLQEPNCDNYQTYYRLMLESGRQIASQGISPRFAHSSFQDSNNLRATFEQCGWEPWMTQQQEQDFLDDPDTITCLEDSYLDNIVAWGAQCEGRQQAQDQHQQQARIHNTYLEGIGEALNTANQLAAHAAGGSGNCSNQQLLNFGLQSAIGVASTLGFGLLQGPLQMAAAFAGDLLNNVLGAIGRNFQSGTDQMTDIDNYQQLACYYLSLEALRCSGEEQISLEHCHECSVQHALPAHLTQGQDALESFLQTAQQIEQLLTPDPASRRNNISYGEHLDQLLSSPIEHSDNASPMALRDYLFTVALNLAQDQEHSSVGMELRNFLTQADSYAQRSQQISQLPASEQFEPLEELQQMRASLDQITPDLHAVFSAYFEISDFDSAQALAEMQRYQRAIESLSTPSNLEYNEGDWLQTMGFFIDGTSSLTGDIFDDQSQRLIETFKDRISAAGENAQDPALRERQFQILEKVLKDCALTSGLHMRPRGGVSHARDPVCGGLNIGHNRRRCNRFSRVCSQFENCPQDSAGHTGFPSTQELNQYQLEAHQCQQLQDHQRQIENFRQEFLNRGTICAKAPRQLSN